MAFMHMDVPMRLAPYGTIFIFFYNPIGIPLPYLIIGNHFFFLQDEPIGNEGENELGFSADVVLSVASELIERSLVSPKNSKPERTENPSKRAIYYEPRFHTEFFFIF